MLAAAAVAVLVLATFVVVRSGAGEAAAPGDGATALVVSANLQDAIRPADASDTRDLDTFVRRLAASTPTPPDVLLLTEVLGPGAKRVADRLTEATGKRYAVVLAPGGRAFLADGTVRESAVVVNTATMRVVHDGELVRVQSEDQAYAVLAKRGTNLRLPVISAHAGGDPLVAVTKLDQVVRAYASDDADVLPVLGGDYRSSRCLDARDYQPVDCVPQPFWPKVTNNLAYEDALFDVSGAETDKRSGYLFARASVADGHVDTAYDEDLPDRAACKAKFDRGKSASASAACRHTYYADEPFGWAVLGARDDVERLVAPAKVTLDHCELGVRRGAAVARVVNDTEAEVTEPVSAAAAEPLHVRAASDTVTVPAGEARTVLLTVTAPQDITATAGKVDVTIGEQRREIAVSVPKECTESVAVATSFHPGFPPENAVDGDINTIWHSEYSPPNPLPQSITLNLRETKEVGTVGYQPRFDANLNGTITEYNVYVSADGQAFSKVASGTWAADARRKTATFDKVQARYVRLEAVKASGGSFCSAAEVTVE